MQRVAQIPFDLPVRPSLGREDFLVAPSNHMAVKFIDAWPAWPMHALVLFGPKASGKTHLAAVWQARTQACDISDVQDFNMLSYDKNPTHVVVDNLEDIILRHQEEQLFHLYNSVRENNKAILIISEKSPSALSFTLPDLASRMRASTAVEINPPDDVLLKGLLVKLFYDRQIKISPNVISYLVTRMDRSFTAARDLVAAIDSKAMAEQRAVTIPLIQGLLDMKR